MNDHVDPGHGHSPAAWTAVVIMIVALSAGTVFFFLGMWTLVWVSAGVTLIGALTGPVMAAMGYGVRGPKYQPKGH